MTRKILPVIEQQTAHAEIICPHCYEIIYEKHVGYDSNDDITIHKDCGGLIELPQTDWSRILPEWRPSKNKRKAKEIVRNRHNDDQEIVYDDGDQVLNDQLEESLTTGSIAAPLAGFPESTQTVQGSKGHKMSNRMKQPGKAIGNRKVKNEPTGRYGTDMKDHGSPFGMKQVKKNRGGQEKFGSGGEGTMKEHMTPAEIAGTINDDSMPLQQLFNEYVNGVNYVCLPEFNEITRAYGCACQDEHMLMQLMAANRNYMFIEGQDYSGRYWIPQVIQENISNFGGKQAKPFGKEDNEDKDDDGNDNIRLSTPEDKLHSKKHKADRKDTKKGKKPWEESRRRGRRPLNEGTLNEVMGGFEYEEPEEHFRKHRDPDYGHASSMSDIPMFDTEEGGGVHRDVEEMLGSKDLMGSGDLNDDFGETPGFSNVGEFGAHEHSAMRSGDAFSGRYGEDVGGEKCPECQSSMDEIGCPECGYTPDDFAGHEPDPMTSEFDEFDKLDEFNPEEDEFNLGMFESRRGRRTINEHDKVAMNGPHGNSVEPHPGKSGGRDSKLPKTKTDMTDMGKEWPRKQKNTGGQEKFSDSKHGEGCDGIQSHMRDMNLGGKQKNTGGQWEQFEGGQHGGKMGGGTKKMYESVGLLANHIKRTLAEYANNSNIVSRDGKYPMRFVVSAGNYVKPKVHNQLTEASADAEELIQILGPDAVSFEAQFCRPDGSIALKRLVPMIRIHQRGPIVQESNSGGRLLFRFPEIARDYADLVVSEGKACRATAHNWGAAITANISYRNAINLFNNMQRLFKE